MITEYTFTISTEEKTRLDKFLSGVLEDKSRTQIQRYIADGFVKVNQEKVLKSSLKLEVADVVQIRIPPKADSHLEPAEMELEILFENDDLLVINKPPDMVVHPAPGHSSGTLVQGVMYYIPDIEGVGEERRPGVVHRLDKDTSGVILFAKNDKAHHAVQAQFMDRSIDKTYLALADGFPPTPTGRIDAAIGRDPRNRQKMALVQDHLGKPAHTEYKVLERFEKHSLLEVKIFTGRTHQIRLHLAFIGCPVAADSVYGRGRKTVEADRQMLHAWKISLQLPGETKKTEFIAELPEDFREVLQELRKTGS